MRTLAALEVQAQSAQSSVVAAGSNTQQLAYLTLFYDSTRKKIKMENVKTVMPWFAVCLSLVISTQAKAAVAPPAQPCLAPLQWEGRIVEYDHGTGRNTRASMSYDGQNQRIRILEQKKGHVPCKKYVKVFIV